MDYLLRDDAPLGGESWKKIDDAVISTARSQLLGRKFLNIYGPLGAGIQSININELEADFKGKVDYDGEDETTSVKIKSRKYVEIPMIYKDFTISWRDLENSKQMGLPLDLSSATVAATACVTKEDKLIFWGDEDRGLDGIMTADGRQIIKKNNWKEGEIAFSDVAEAMEKLVNKGHYGPYVLVLSPDLFVQLQRIQPGTGKLEIERLKQLIGGKIYQSPILGINKAVLLEKGIQNMDLVVGQDLITAYLGPENLNNVFRILETVLLRIKRPDTIVTFE